MALLSLSDWGPLDTKRIIHLRETQSTNSDAFLEASKGASTGTWIIADHQRAGRGRSNRSWISLPGNLFASIILKDLYPYRKIPELSLVCGVAFHQSVLKIAKIPLRANVELKWPNDLLIERKKIGGILIESSCDHNCGGSTVVVGFGLNLHSHPEIENQKSTCLRDYHINVVPMEFLKALDDHLYYSLVLWSEDEGLFRIKNDWLASSLPIGTPISINGSKNTISGVFHGISEDGYLIIQNALHELEIISFGDVCLDA